MCCGLGPGTSKHATDSAFATELNPPATINVPENARAIDARLAAAPARQISTGASARWSTTQTRQLGAADTWQRKSGVSQAALVTDSGARTEPAAPVESGSVPARGLGSFVRPASQTTPLDPLDDPFGDRSSPPLGSPIRINSPQQSAPPPNPAPAEPVPPAPAPYVPPRRAETPAPLFPSPSNGSNGVYNGRNCAEELNSCRIARDFVSGGSIRQISLDITPALTVAQLDGQDIEFYEHELERTLARAPSHVFHDRRGNVVAEGRVTDFRWGRVWIMGADGQTQEIPFTTLSEEDICFVTGWWSIPTECATLEGEYHGRYWEGLTLTWKASGVCHKPLYFEEVQLERYGHSASPFIQPVISTAHFFANIAALPYNMGIHPPSECQYPLGYYRPGNCAPWLVPPVPLSVRGGLLAAGAYLGLIYVIP